MSDCNLMDYIGCQAPLSVGFSRPEYWSGQPFPSPEDLPNPGHCRGILYQLSYQGSPVPGYDSGGLSQSRRLNTFLQALSAPPDSGVSYTKI